jgi:hypothetical protein
METYEEFVRESLKKYPQPSLRPPGGAREGFEKSRAALQRRATGVRTTREEKKTFVRRSSYPKLGKS